MKRRSQKEPQRNREMEQIKAMTTVTMTESDLRDRLVADKTSLEAKLAEALRERNELRKACREHPDVDPTTYLMIPSSAHLQLLAERIADCGAQLRSIKEKLR